MKLDFVVLLYSCCAFVAKLVTTHSVQLTELYKLVSEEEKYNISDLPV